GLALRETIPPQTLRAWRPLRGRRAAPAVGLRFARQSHLRRFAPGGPCGAGGLRPRWACASRDNPTPDASRLAAPAGPAGCARGGLALRETIPPQALRAWRPLRGRRAAPAVGLRFARQSHPRRFAPGGPCGAGGLRPR